MGFFFVGIFSFGAWGGALGGLGEVVEETVTKTQQQRQRRRRRRFEEDLRVWAQSLGPSIIVQSIIRTYAKLNTR